MGSKPAGDRQQDGAARRRRAQGRKSAQLRAYLFGALDAGFPPEKIQETLAMMTVYAGFPAALNALEVWRAVRDSAARQQVPGDGPA